MKTAPHPDHQPKAEHGTTQSYVLGFVLSLVFTAIPYELVVKHTLSGTTLLIMIIGFAVLQMLIQLVFFLHLGRGPQASWNVYFLVATVVLILVVVSGSIVIINNLHYNMSPQDQLKKLANDEGIYQVGDLRTGACQGVHTNHVVTISNAVVSPVHTDAKLCDTLTFVNKDPGNRDMSFGEQSSHEVYAGVSEHVVPKGYNITFTLSESGTYKFRDTLNEQTVGDFTVTP